MAGYLKVLSSLTRSAATLSKNPAVLVPASCQSLQQRNCEFSTFKSVCRYVSKAALTGALTPVNAYLARWAFKFKYPYTPATCLMFISVDVGFGQSYFFQSAGLQILFAAFFSLFAASSGTLFSR